MANPLKIKNLDNTVALLIVKGLTDGMTEKEIMERLQEAGIKPNSARTIDLYISELRKRNKCKTTFQLMYELGRGMQLKIN